MMRTRTRFAAAAVVTALIPGAALAGTGSAAAAPSDGCKSWAGSSPTHLYTYEGKGIAGFYMNERRNSPLHWHECLKTFGKTISGRFSYHDDMGTTSDHSYYYLVPWPFGSNKNFYRLLTTDRQDFSNEEVYVLGDELTYTKP
ncbi:hypothetical protein CU254_42040 (plasmid) [Amycolatopsis sp. AA4]|nr:hypothetical protein CU254_42040 [Amycolatopsis sp. AA4]EFL12609.1 predicted protein [Streptomyces sp. AA4]